MSYLYSMQTRLRSAVTFACIAAAVVACGRSEPPATPPVDDAGNAADAALPAQRDSAPENRPQPADVSVSGKDATVAEAKVKAKPSFDIESVPISDRPLGDFPYFSLPSGYRSSDHNSHTSDLSRFPFWVGNRFEWVEGRTYNAEIRTEGDKDFSALELKRNIEHVVGLAGGVKIADAVLPEQAQDAGIVDQVRDEYSDGLCFMSDPLQTYLIRRHDREIWVQACTHGDRHGAWVIAETAAFEPTASLLPSSELKRQLDDAGKVAIEVHFATDQAQILPESKPQIEQVVQLLQQHPQLRLWVDGHTDDTGGAEHNQALSEARAQSVVAALNTAGIDNSRLRARGFGASQPVADNDSETGRARNRRVELVRIDSP